MRVLILLFDPKESNIGGGNVLFPTPSGRTCRDRTPQDPKGAQRALREGPKIYGSGVWGLGIRGLGYVFPNSCFSFRL